ncbi:hypothetical protein FRD01_08535 [Microvenator marinus]|jgi:hypothetical protein|uniref:Uncharacterized protein n=1 Tax=Microvenator marinus TaxID=2600177 RepID=A0A5B8XQN3_9DELT|nr:hypothetical protein [Microvenator marinus]QED27288.1 hypothetical protein FRD01_08535 [Microvenator marinus]
MQADWNGHAIKITGNWTFRWLFLAPEYELWIDDQRIDRTGGPRLSPKLEAMVEDEGEIFHIEADILSIAGWRPKCDLSVGGELLKSDKIEVENFLNPFLVIFILAATSVMLYVGPTVLRDLIN